MRPSAIHSDQPLQPCVHRRQIILPPPLAFASWKLRIAALHFFLKVHTHPCHHFEILHHSTTDSVCDLFTVSRQLLQRGQKFWFEVGIVHVHQQVFMAALPHQVTDALVHRNSR